MRARTHHRATTLRKGKRNRAPQTPPQNTLAYRSACKLALCLVGEVKSYRWTNIEPLFKCRETSHLQQRRRYAYAQSSCQVQCSEEGCNKEVCHAAHCASCPARANFVSTTLLKSLLVQARCLIGLGTAS